MDKTEQEHVVQDRDQNIHIVSSGTVKMDPAKIQAIANRLEPKTETNSTISGFVHVL